MGVINVGQYFYIHCTIYKLYICISTSYASRVRIKIMPYIIYIFENLLPQIIHACKNNRKLKIGEDNCEKLLFDFKYIFKYVNSSPRKPRN